MPRRHRHEDPSWQEATFRNREPWTPAEERLLQQIYAKPRRVKWMGRWRKPLGMYHAAKVLGRSPTACAGRMGLLRQFKRK